MTEVSPSQAGSPVSRLDEGREERARETGELFPVSGADMGRLQARLARDADRHDLLDVAYRLIDSPLGPLLLAATPKGLVRVAFEREGFDAVLTALADRVSPRVLRDPARLDAEAAQFDEYFTGHRHTFTLPLDHAMSAGFRRLVQSVLPQIAYGSTRSYKQVAALVGNPKASRAVGSACATNPLPIVVPCHRVLRADGSLGGYIGGLPAKSALLSLEGSGRSSDVL